LLQLTEYMEATHGFVRVDLASKLWAASSTGLQTRMVQMETLTNSIDLYMQQVVEAQLVDNRFLEFIGVKDAVIRKQLKTAILPKTNGNNFN